MKHIINLLAVIGFFFLLGFILLAVLSNRSNDNIDLLAEFKSSQYTPLDTNIFEQSCAKDNKDILSCFPYQYYFSRNTWSDPYAVSRDIELLDLWDKGRNIEHRKAMAEVLTNQLKEKIFSIESNNMDTLLMLVKFAEKYEHFSLFNPQDPIQYRVIHSYWMNYVSNRFSLIYSQNKTIKYYDSFKYINNRCREQKYGCSVGYNYFEKVVNNMIESKFGYLWRKMKYSATIYHWSVLILVLLYIPYSLFIIYKVYIKKGKNYES